MSYRNQRRLLVVICVVGNLALWAIPANVLKLIAEDRPVLFGRYSREQFTWMLVALVATVIAFYIGLPNEAGRRRRGFQVLAGLGLGLPVLVVLDAVVTVIRASNSAPYVFDGLAYHRPAGYRVSDEFEDLPESARSYPERPDGYGKVAFDFSFDERGFRNTEALDRCDVLVLGDSFAEGSRVSDQENWPAILARRTGLRVYNLGMSGYDPQHYLAALKKHGPALGPRLVLCMIYEGNDFRSAEWIEDPEHYKLPVSRVFQHYLRNSLVISSLDRILTGTFGRIGCRGEVRGGEVFSWMPVRVEGGRQATHYAFAPKRMLAHLETAEEFRKDKDWTTTVRILKEIRKTCEQLGAGLLIVYAPDKPRVVLPLVRERLEADKVRAFAALRTAKLPETDVFVDQLFARMDSMESVTREFCESESTPFVTTTPALSRAIADGRQAYYTYDQHWTPVGHEVVADVLADALEGPLAALLETGTPKYQKASASLDPSP